MATAQGKGHEEDKHSGMQAKKKQEKQKKKEKRKVGSKRIPRWGRVQMTQAERRRTIKYVLA